MYMPMCRFKSADQTWKVVSLGEGTDSLNDAQSVCETAAKNMKQGMCWIAIIPIPAYQPALKLLSKELADGDA